MYPNSRYNRVHVYRRGFELVGGTAVTVHRFCGGQHKLGVAMVSIGIGASPTHVSGSSNMNQVHFILPDHCPLREYRLERVPPRATCNAICMCPAAYRYLPSLLLCPATCRCLSIYCGALQRIAIYLSITVLCLCPDRRQWRIARGPDAGRDHGPGQRDHADHVDQPRRVRGTRCHCLQRRTPGPYTRWHVELLDHTLVGTPPASCPLVTTHWFARRLHRAP